MSKFVMLTRGIQIFFRKRNRDPVVLEKMLDDLGVYLEAENVAVTLRKGHVERGQKEAVVGLHIYVDFANKGQGDKS